ncbi:RING finger protein 208-like [Centropristis striata]|uniref:RING finger protein 208-like n=1 Tax=Centropristis striata TaxID=184440 RepID=UPI0027E01A0C|nr:RING finger protein 208-like [Centropristis striata]
MAEAGGTGGDFDSAPPDVNECFSSEDYECKICYNYFDLGRHTPKLLSCSHTFCRECLDAMHSGEGRGWRVGCPVCRNRTPVPEYRVDKLPDNSALTVSLPLINVKPEDSLNTDVQRSPTVSSLSSEVIDCSCHTCIRHACVAVCVCAIFSCMAIVLFVFVVLLIMKNPFKTSVCLPICVSSRRPFSLCYCAYIGAEASNSSSPIYYNVILCLHS